jgi:hypothetical protein
LEEAARLIDHNVDRVEVMGPCARLYLAQGRYGLAAAVARQAPRLLRGDQLRSAALDIPEQPDRSVTDVVVDALASRRLLLVLDNCEHLATACARFVEAVLQNCPRVRILATSP